MGKGSDTTCEHIQAWQNVIEPTSFACAECVQTGSQWVHLRTCQTCGVTLCCDSSDNKHATAHAKETGHPVVISAEPNERWAWCYIDEELHQY